MFDLYIYDSYGDFIEMIPDVSRDRWVKVAMNLSHEGFSVKVIDQADGVVVYTVGYVG